MCGVRTCLRRLQKQVPGIAQSLVLEDATILTFKDVVEGAKELMATELKGRSTTTWVPPRYFV